MSYQFAIKRISSVEAGHKERGDEARTSNQHEFNGTAALKRLLGAEEARDDSCRWIDLRDNGESEAVDVPYSWYESRKPPRSEWRLYYGGSPELAEGDLVCLARRSGEAELVVFVAARGSSWESQILAIIGTPAPGEGSFVHFERPEISPLFLPVALELFRLADWGDPAAGAPPFAAQELTLVTSDGRFPTTRELSGLARSSVSEALDPDELLLAWWHAEEALFKALEHTSLASKLAGPSPFHGVEDFLKFSLSIQNRRKSRAGHALENHVEALLTRHGLRHSRGATTEGGRRPDFLLPGAAEYGDPMFPDDRLTVLAAKTTCKDRWRQILNEARRVATKHLITLEPAISERQIAEMQDEGVQLVVPSPLHGTFQRLPAGFRLWSVMEFLAFARSRQG